MAEKVDKLLQADFIKEITYLEWIANVVMVKKANDKWRICIGFSDLNKAYPKDNYPLSRIDLMVDKIAPSSSSSMVPKFPTC